MPDNLASGADTDTTLGFAALFTFVNQEYRETVVRRALDSREQVPDDTRQALNSAVREYVTVDGFRNADRAPVPHLKEPILRTVLYSNKLAGAVLRLWAESHKELRQLVIDHLNSRAIPAEYPDFSKDRFRGSWTDESWQSERDQIIELHGDLDADDVGLMLCYVSGKSPVQPVNGSAERLDTKTQKAVRRVEHILSEFLGFLRDMPADAPVWDGVVPEFVDSVNQIRDQKEAERHLAANLESTVTEIREEFKPELAFFQLNIDSWPVASLLPGPGLSETLRLTSELKDLLAEYRPVRETAPVISEELDRRKKREELEQRILDTIRDLSGLRPDGQSPDGNPPRSGSATNKAEADKEPPVEPSASQPERDDEPATGSNLAPVESADGDTGDEESTEPKARGGKQQPSGEHGAGRDDRGGASVAAPAVAAEQHPETGTAIAIVQQTATAPAFPHEEYASLQLENQDLQQMVESLESELHDSRSMAESWHTAYLYERKGPESSELNERSSIQDVGSAVEMAKGKFRGKLLFLLNSKSEVEDNTFDSPLQVWDALEWLATTYHPSRAGELSEPDFDSSIRRACGWWYKGHQNDSTINNRKYRHWYTTKDNGKTYRLNEHIGTGTNKDPRYTIRLAFDWDKDRQRVVIGFIGQHQQTDAT